MRKACITNSPPVGAISFLYGLELSKLMISCNKLTLSEISQSLKCNGIFGVKAFSGRDNKEKRRFFNINQCKKNIIVSFNKNC